jgi:4'-phosphopantetheinyl transferase EntD
MTLTQQSAERSESLQALFPAGVVAVKLRSARPAEAEETLTMARRLLTGAEWQSIAHCQPKRIHDFLAGRLCAHRALAAFGMQQESLLPESDRQPRWPEGLCGSITHTEGYSAAVVGRCSEIGALGIDAEPIEAVQSDLWPKICTSEELASLQRLAPQLLARAATLTFVAKEAFYKAQYGVTRERLEFGDVVVCVETVGEAGHFYVRPQRELRWRGGAEGRFVCDGGFLVAGVALPVETAYEEGWNGGAFPRPP